VALLGSGVAHTPKVLVSRELPSVRERWLALAMLYRLRVWRAGHSLGLALGRKA
jgi:hypothetical protein